MKALILTLAFAAAPGIALAQQANTNLHAGVDHAGHSALADSSVTRLPIEPGQGAFAAIQEIADILAADETTDWSKVDLEALRRHLIDMNNVTLHAKVTSVPTDGGMIFSVTGDGEVRGSIARMVTAHATTMNSVASFTYEAAENIDGATLIARTDNPADVEKLSGLGFIGVMTLGAHHQEHHIVIARGGGPHN